MKCLNCGQENDPDAKFCSECGNRLTMAENASGKQSPTITIHAKPAMLYAGFWKRLAAVLLDWLVLLIPFLALFFSRLLLTPGGQEGPHQRFLMNPVNIEVVGILLYWPYFALMECSRYQATLGKMVFGIKVVDLQGQQISFARASGRFFAKYLSAFIMGIGFLMAAFTQRKQALHDMLAGTLVVMKNVGPEQFQIESRLASRSERMPIKAHKLAIATLALGLVSLLAWAFAVVLGLLYPPPLGHYSPLTGEAGPIIMVLMLLSFLLELATWITGVIALVRIKRQGQKGMGATSTGMILAAIPIVISKPASNLVRYIVSMFLAIPN